MLFTIGYQGHTPDSYFTLLRRARVKTLCDVRANAFSHKRGFSKGALSRAAAAAGISYEHLPQLGVAATERRKVKTDADREAMLERYARKTLPQQRESLRAIRARVRGGERLALGCFEHDPADCHRGRLVRALRVPCTHL